MNARDRSPSGPSTTRRTRDGRRHRVGPDRPVPRDLPSGQSNDVNARIRTDLGPVTLNFHNNEAFWSGTTSFVYRTPRT